MHDPLCACGCGQPAALPYAHLGSGGWWRNECGSAVEADAVRIRAMLPGERAVLRSVFEVAGLPALARLCGAFEVRE